MASLSKCRVNVNVDFTATDNTAGVNTSASGLVGLNNGNTLAFSIGTNTINSVNQAYYPTAISLAGGANTTIDLTNGTANKTPTNNALSLSRAKILIVKAIGANTTNYINGVLINSSHANSAFNVGGTVPPNGAIAWINPTANGNTINSVLKNIKLENLDATNSVNVYVFVGGANA